MTESTVLAIILAIIAAMPGIGAFLVQRRRDADQALGTMVDKMEKRIDSLYEDIERMEDRLEEERAARISAEQRAAAAERSESELRRLLEEANNAVTNFTKASTAMRVELNKYKQWGIVARQAMQAAGIDVPRFPDTGELTEPRS